MRKDALSISRRRNLSEGSLLSFVGDGLLVMPWESVTERAEILGLSAESAEVLQKERERWEKMQKASGKQKAAGIPEGTFAWVPSGGLSFASIIGTERVNWSGSILIPTRPTAFLACTGEASVASYSSTALFIWHQQQAPSQK